MTSLGVNDADTLSRAEEVGEGLREEEKEVGTGSGRTTNLAVLRWRRGWQRGACRCGCSVTNSEQKEVIQVRRSKVVVFNSFQVLWDIIR